MKWACLLAALLGTATTRAAETEEMVVDDDDWFYNVEECATSSSLRCWTAPTTYRISSETEKESPYSAQRSGLKLSAAANEFEGFQVRFPSVLLVKCC